MSGSAPPGYNPESLLPAGGGDIISVRGGGMIGGDKDFYKDGVSVLGYNLTKKQYALFLEDGTEVNGNTLDEVKAAALSGKPSALTGKPGDRRADVARAARAALASKVGPDPASASASLSVVPEPASASASLPVVPDPDPASASTSLPVSAPAPATPPKKETSKEKKKREEFEKELREIELKKAKKQQLNNAEKRRIAKDDITTDQQKIIELTAKVATAEKKLEEAKINVKKNANGKKKLNSVI
jgi:hypothetical protein